MRRSLTAMTEEIVLYTSEDKIATIALNQPDSRNALSDALLDALIAAFERARDDDEVGCVVLASTHETVFSAGGDLGGFAEELTAEQRYERLARFPALFELIGTLGKPTICAARGHVLAGALGIALACDLVVASEKATFGTPELNVGVFPFMIMALIYRNVPRKKTTEMLLLSERIDANEAERLGIVNKVVPLDQFDEAVGEWAATLASKSPLLMRMGKDAIWKQQDLDLIEALDFLRGQLGEALGTEDVREGVSAFFEKREPQWKGR